MDYFEEKVIEPIEPDGTFEERTEPCPYCGMAWFRYAKNGPHIGVYCKYCDRLVKFTPRWNNEKHWARKVKERDRYTCQRCGKVLQGREAHAHHKIPRWFMPDLQFDLNNGICLCTACHKQIHGKGGTLKESED